MHESTIETFPVIKNKEKMEKPLEEWLVSLRSQRVFEVKENA